MVRIGEGPKNLIRVARNDTTNSAEEERRKKVADDRAEKAYSLQ